MRPPPPHSSPDKLSARSIRELSALYGDALRADQAKKGGGCVTDFEDQLASVLSSRKDARRVLAVLHEIHAVELAHEKLQQQYSKRRPPPALCPSRPGGSKATSSRTPSRPHRHLSSSMTNVAEINEEETLGGEAPMPEAATQQLEGRNDDRTGRPRATSFEDEGRAARTGAGAGWGGVAPFSSSSSPQRDDHPHVQVRGLHVPLDLFADVRRSHPAP